MKAGVVKLGEEGGCCCCDPNNVDLENVIWAVRLRLETVLSLRRGSDGHNNNDADNNKGGVSTAEILLQRYSPISSDLIRSLIDDDGDDPSESPPTYDDVVDDNDKNKNDNDSDNRSNGVDDNCDGSNSLMRDKNENLKKSFRSLSSSLWCSSKPALNVLILRLQHWTVSGQMPQRDYEDFVVTGVVEILPDWAKMKKKRKKKGMTTTELNDDDDHENDSNSNIDTSLRIPETFRLLQTKIAEAADVDEIIDSLFESIGGKPGILYLLGHRSTVGSIETLCPPLPVLLRSFQKPHTCTNNNKKGCGSTGKLTVGARALAKHCHRTSNNTFWPESKGNDHAKNQLAMETLLKILSDAAWINCHVVPIGKDQQQLPIVEIRHYEGYGARWSADGTVFRGFLEPVSPFYTATEEG